MKAGVSFQVRVPLEDAKLIELAAKAANLKPSTYIRVVAVSAAREADTKLAA